MNKKEHSLTDTGFEAEKKQLYKAPATPENWHWAITPQQINEIKQGNRDIIDQVYFDNLPTLRKVVFSFCCKRDKQQFVDDCLQQIYIDLPNYNYKNVQTLFWSIKRSCYYAYGYRQSEIRAYVSLDSPLQSKGSKCQEKSDRTLADTIPAIEVDYLEVEEQEKKLLTILDSLDLSEDDKDVMTAIAFDCAVKRGLYDWLQQKYKQNLDSNRH